MRQAILGLALAMAIAPSASAAFKRIYLNYNGNKAKTSYEDLRKFTVCSLKIPASKKFGLNPYKIVLKMNGRVLREGATLASLGIGDKSEVDVVKVNSTSQCKGQYPGFRP